MRGLWLQTELLHHQKLKQVSLSALSLAHCAGAMEPRLQGSRNTCGVRTGVQSPCTIFSSKVKQPCKRCMLLDLKSVCKLFVQASIYSKAMPYAVFFVVLWAAWQKCLHVRAALGDIRDGLEMDIG